MKLKTQNFTPQTCFRLINNNETVNTTNQHTNQPPFVGVITEITVRPGQQRMNGLVKPLTEPCVLLLCGPNTVPAATWPINVVLKRIDEKRGIS